MNQKKISISRRPLLTLLAGLLLASALAASWSCLGYLVAAGQGQLSILWNRRPLQEVIADSATEPKVRDNLRHVLAIRLYAREHLGLTPGNSYTTYSDIKRPYAAWNVSAAPELSLRPRTWWFPIVGAVPYLGFFSLQEAREKERELQKEGFDTVLRPVPAYSTLGWFDDPLLSSQAKYSRYYLTGIVIHEAAHATLWFPGDVAFNESFASFVEEKGTLEYYRTREGPEHPAYRKKLRYLEDRERVTALFQKYARRLQELYNSRISPEEKRKRKKIILHQFPREFTRLSRPDSVLAFESYARKKYNNAHFLSFLRYNSGGSYFRKIFNHCRENWRCFLQSMKKLEKLSPAARSALIRETRR